MAVSVSSINALWPVRLDHAEHGREKMKHAQRPGQIPPDTTDKLHKHSKRVSAKCEDNRKTDTHILYHDQ